MMVRSAAAVALVIALAAGASAQAPELFDPGAPATGPRFGYVAPGATFRLEGNTGFATYLRGDPGRPKRLYSQPLSYAGVDKNDRYWVYDGGDLQWAFAIDSSGRGFPLFFRTPTTGNQPAGTWRLYGHARRVLLGRSTATFAAPVQYGAGEFFSHITYGDRLYGVQENGVVKYYDPENQAWFVYKE